MNRGAIVEAIRTVVRELFPRLEFAGDYEYRVDAQAGAFVDVRPVDASLQLPQIRQMPFRGSAGYAATVKPGTRVLVRFVNSDPGRPYVTGIVGEDDTGHGPLSVRILAEESLTVTTPEVTLGDADTDVFAGGGHARVLRSGDQVNVVLSGTVTAGAPGSINALGTITLNAATEGPPPGGYSRVRA
jgi:hypothetical protein